MFKCLIWKLKTLYNIYVFRLLAGQCQIFSQLLKFFRCFSFQSFRNCYKYNKVRILMCWHREVRWYFTWAPLYSVHSVAVARWPACCQLGPADGQGQNFPGLPLGIQSHKKISADSFGSLTHAKLWLHQVLFSQLQIGNIKDLTSTIVKSTPLTIN